MLPFPPLVFQTLVFLLSYRQTMNHHSVVHDIDANTKQLFQNLQYVVLHRWDRAMGLQERVCAAWQAVSAH